LKDSADLCKVAGRQERTDRIGAVGEADELDPKLCPGDEQQASQPVLVKPTKDLGDVFVIEVARRL
jgi:hypothetical protein